MVKVVLPPLIPLPAGPQIGRRFSRDQRFIRQREA